MAHCVIKRGSKNLSGFYPNGLKDVFAFRKNDWSIFTKSDAEAHIEHIKREVSDKRNTERWGEKITKNHQSIARNLKVVCEE